MGNERLIAAGLAALDRTAISRSIEALIGLLDLIDGDPDAEDDDPGGGNVTDEPHDPESEDGQ